MLKALSVTQINTYISNVFEAEELLQYVKVYEEISNLSYVRGNLYFNLKDKDALLPCIMFGVGSCDVKEGDQIIASGGIKFYAKGGRINLYVNSIAPYGSGELYKAFIELKNKLEVEGVFDKKFKKPLPKQISKIGVITSSTGAVLHDIVTVSHRRNPTLNIDVYPARVQGKGAEKTIIDGLKYFDNCDDIDVIIIARGGGSIEDLQPFNTETLAREIIKNSKPVISAVGHEVDFTICDFASSIRAATPSEAAELVAQDIFAGFDLFKNNLSKLNYLIYNMIDDNAFLVDNNLKKLNANYNQFIYKKKSKFDLIVSKFMNLNFVDKIEKNLTINYNKLLTINPKSISKMGWAKIVKKDLIINSINDITKYDNVEIKLFDGNFEAKVLKVNN